MVKDGWVYALAFGAAALSCGLIFEPWSAVPLAAAGVFCLYFFRDPDRVIPPGPVCVSPADGKVVQVREEAEGRTRVSILLSIFDVLVNRAPVAGLVRSVRYTPGGFRMAHIEAASMENERNTLVIEERESGLTLETKQIAGWIARRIVCRKKAGDNVEKGERFGLIKFGSRVDIVLGPEWRLAVQRGDRVAAGSSVIASLDRGGRGADPT